MGQIINLEQFGNEVDWDSDFALVGMGQSKSEHIFPKNVITICINKSHFFYKGKPNYCCTVYDHKDDLIPLIPTDVPFVVIEKEDFLKFNLSLGGPICSLFYFISKRIKDNHTIFLIGNEMSDKRDWTPYIMSFYQAHLDNLQYRKKVKVKMLDGNERLVFFQ